MSNILKINWTELNWKIVCIVKDTWMMIMYYAWWIHTAHYLDTHAIISPLCAQIKGLPFGNIFSVSDGPYDNSTGVIYFYVTPMDNSVTDLKSMPYASLTFSEAEGNFCRYVHTHHIHPLADWPLYTFDLSNGTLTYISTRPITWQQLNAFSHPHNGQQDDPLQYNPSIRMRKTCYMSSSFFCNL